MGKEADELRQRAKEAWEAKHKAADSSSPLPPPMRNLYRGKTHQRIVQELSSNAGTKEAHRSKAQARRDASLRYAKLVNELSDPSNPAEGIGGFDSASPAISRAGLAPGITPGGAASGPVDMKALGAAASALNAKVTHASHRCPSAPAPQCPSEHPSTPGHRCTGAPDRAPTHPPTHPPPHTCRCARRRSRCR
jgi:hypothetical protein